MRQDGFHYQETMTIELCGSDYSSWVREKNFGKKGIGMTVCICSAVPSSVQKFAMSFFNSCIEVLFIQLKICSF